jgi:hypothetical protein
MERIDQTVVDHRLDDRVARTAAATPHAAAARACAAAPRRAAAALPRLHLWAGQKPPRAILSKQAS